MASEGGSTQLLRGFIERAGRANVDPMMTSVGLEVVLGRTYGDTAGPDMKADDERYIDTLSELIMAFAERGNIVIVGRGAQALLREREDTLHVRIACPQEERIRRIAERDAMALDDASDRVRDSRPPARRRGTPSTSTSTIASRTTTTSSSTPGGSRTPSPPS